MYAPSVERMTPVVSAEDTESGVIGVTESSVTVV